MQRKTLIHLPLSNEGRKVKIETYLPILFLAGPIRNAPSWQNDAIGMVLDKNAEVFIACPTRHVTPQLIPLLEKDKEEYEEFVRQRAWEQYYLYAAAKKGCIVLWLPKEVTPKEFPEKVYAHITMVEIGLLIERKKNDPSINLVIGTDGEFPEWSTIEFELKTEIPSVQIFNSLQETIEAALIHCNNSAILTEKQREFFAAKPVDLDLSIRTTNCLRRVGVITMKDFLTPSVYQNFYSSKYIQRNMGKRNMQELKELFNSHGLQMPKE